MTARRGFCLAIFICGTIMAGLAATHFIWLNPDVIGPFALMIGMTPLVLLFEYSLDVPTYWFPIGVICSITSWLMLLRNPPHPLVAKLVLLGGGVLACLGFLIFIVASIYYNVGMAGPIPTEWYYWVRPGSRIGNIGLLLLAAGFLIKITSGRSDSFSAHLGL